jgi:hypothetical protein
MLRLLLKILKDEQGAVLAMAYTFSPNTLIASTQMNANMDAIIAVVNALEADNLSADCVTAVKLNSDVVRSTYGLIQHTDGTLYVDLSDTNPGLELSDGGLRAKVDDSSIERASGGLQVKALGITNAMLAGSIDDGKLSQLVTADKVANSALVQILTASKVGGAALTLLTAIPAAAGIIPVANGSTGHTKIAMGKVEVVQGENTITFDSAFSNANYKLVAILIQDTTMGGGYAIRSRTASGFTFYTNASGETFYCEYIAIGD